LENNLIKFFFNNEDKDPQDHFEKHTGRGATFYKFNNGKNMNGTKIVDKYQKVLGYSGGITAEVFVGIPDQFDHQFTPQTHTSFFSMYIHNKSFNAAESTDNPIKLAPGLSTELRIKRIFKERLSYPYNDCIDNNDGSLIKLNDPLINYIKIATNSYRQKDCFNLCQSQYIIKRCNLSLSIGFIWEIDWRKDNFECAKKQYGYFLEQNLIELCSSCPLECNSIEYDIETTTSKFPSLSYALELMNNPKIKSNYPIGYNITLEDLRESMIQFSVFYTDFHYTYITQIPKFQLENLVSNFGGLLGLFLGMSFLSFGELIEIFVEVLIILCEKRKINNRN
jgi:hypothetical protein